MENIKNIEMPNFQAQPEQKPTKKADKTKKLPRKNRTIICPYCSNEKTLNPDQYQSYYDFLGSEEKIEKEFICKECEMDSKRTPIKFWYKHGEFLQELSKHIRISFDLFNKSSKGNNEFNSMRSMVLFHTKEALIDDANVEFVARHLNNGFPEFHTLKLHKIPHVGTIVIKPYEDKKNRIEIA